MHKKVLSLGSGGKLVLKSPDGKVEQLHRPKDAFTYLVIDCSYSMEGSKISQAKRGAIEFALGALAKSYSVGLIKFTSEAELICDTSREISTLRTLIEPLALGSSTNMAEGIRLATAKLSSKNGLRSMVIVTDGVPDNKEAALNAAQRAKEMGIDIIAIGTDDADKDFLSKLTSRAELADKVTISQLGQSIASAARLLPHGNK